MGQKVENIMFCLLAGGGALPGILARAALARGWEVRAVVFAGQPQPADLPVGVEVERFPLGQIGHILAHLRAHKVQKVALAGHLEKPSLFNLKPDAAGLKLLARAMMMHDDALLRAVTATLEENGFEVVGVAELMPDLLVPAGVLGKHKPRAEDLEDMGLGRSVLGVLGDLDIGQACVVHKGVVLGVEAVEGTDELITRCAGLRGVDNRGGVLIKRAKPLQTELADLPVVGLATMKLLVQHHYTGLALGAQKTLVLERDEMVAMADKAGVFVVVE